MTPKPPSSSDGSSLPPRSRPNLGDFVKDSSELDLWAFDEIESEEIPKKSSSRPSSSNIPEPRESTKKKPPAPEEPFPEKTLGTDKSIRVNVSKEKPKTQSRATSGQATAGGDFDELDHWDEPESSFPVLEIHPSLLSPTGDNDSAGEAVVEEIVQEAQNASPPFNPTVDDDDEFSPVIRENATPVDLVPHLVLSKFERIGLWLLMGILVIGGGAFFYSSIQRLPTETHRMKSGDFPVTGQFITILSAETFWRAPITEGENADTFRRGTALLPVVNLTSSGSAAAVRLFFRNQDGEVMGDSVTSEIKSGVTLQVAATAGFDDVGMHSAYRTGQSKPWTIEVHEAPSASSPISDFKKLFEIEISTDRR